MAKILKFKKGSDQTLLGLTHQEIVRDEEINSYEIFQFFRYLIFQNKHPALEKRKDLKIKKEKYSEFIHYAWEFDLLENIYSQNIRPFPNEALGVIISKSKRIANDIKEITELMNELGKPNDSVPKRTLNDTVPQSQNELISSLIKSRSIAMLMASKAEKDTKIQKNNRPREVLSIVYPILLLKKIYNCIDWDKKKYDDLNHFKLFIHKEIKCLSSLRDLNTITIQNGIKRSKEFTFLDQYLRSVNNEQEFLNIKKYILN